MANTLMEALQGQLQSVTPVANTDESNSLRALMAAKSGKALSVGSTPRASNLGEQASNAQTVDQARALNVQGSLAAAEVGAAADAQQAKADAQSTQLDLQREKQKQTFAQESSRLLQEFQNGQRQLGAEKDAAAVEQLGFASRLASDRYIDELQNAGAMNRLEDQISFDEQLAAAVFADERDLLAQKLKFSDLLNLDENEFRREIGAMDLGFAQSLASAQASAANISATYTAVGNMVSAGAKAGAVKWGDDDKSEGPDHVPAGGANGKSTGQGPTRGGI